MRALLPVDGPDPETADGLHARYSPGRPEWVRANFIASVDGAASVAGRTAGLAAPADKLVFAALRDHADVVLVGAGTVRADGYGAMNPSAQRRARRRLDGRAPLPVLAVVSGGLDVDGSEPWIAGSAVPPLLLTTERAARDVPGAEVVVCGAHRVSLDAALTTLADRGLRGVLCEGGPDLFAQVAATGRLDELCLTISPLLGGPGAARIVSGEPWPAPRPARLTSLLEDDGLLLCRYLLRAA